jgi:hypothetical protein
LDPAIGTVENSEAASNMVDLSPELQTNSFEKRAAMTQKEGSGGYRCNPEEWRVFRKILEESGLPLA